MPRKQRDPVIPITRAELWRVFHTPDPYVSGESLFECAFSSGPAMALVNLALDLRENDRSYKDLEWVREHWELRAKMHSIRERVAATYFMYIAMFQLARPFGAHQLKSSEWPGLEDTSKAQRQALMGMGLLRVRGESLMVRAARARAEVQCAIQNGVATIWIDNYHRHRYATTPEGSRDRSFTSTAVALLPSSPGHIAAPWTGWPTPANLVATAATIGGDILLAGVRLREAVKPLTLGDGLGLDVLRVPLDVKRPHVASTQWEPYAVWDENVSAGAGFQSVVHRVLQVAGTRTEATAVLMDIDLWWRVVKLVYLESNAKEMPIRTSMSRFVPLFGIWHAYKHCVMDAYRVFLPFLVPLEYEEYLRNPTTTNVFTSPSLVAIERLFLSAYLVSRKNRYVLSSEQPPAYTGPGEKPPLYNEQWRALRTLMLQILPSLIVLGIRVRNCSWDVCKGDGAREAIMAALILCEVMSPQKQDGNYKNAMRICLLMWDKFHDSLPGSSHCEEKCEALLSRLARLAVRNPHICTVPKFDEAFVCMRQKTMTTKRTDTYLSQAAVTAVEGRMNRVLNYFQSGKLPFIKRPPGDKGKSTNIQGTTEWPTEIWFPTMDMSTWTTEGLTMRFYESLAVLFTHGCYIPRGPTDSRPMSSHHKRAWANNLCAKGICRWAFGADWGTRPTDDAEFFKRFRKGLEACRTLHTRNRYYPKLICTCTQLPSKVMHPRWTH